MNGNTQDEPREDDRRGDRRGVAEQLGPRVLREAVEDDRELQADEHEEQRVGDEDEDLPDRGAREARLHLKDARGVPAEIEAGAHRGEDARDAGRLSRQVGEVAREQRDRDRRRRARDPADRLRHQVADDETDDDPRDDPDHEARAGLEEAERPGEHGRDRELVGDERGRVVDEALPLDDRHDAPRDAHLPRDRCRRERIGRRQDRAEDERRGPGQADDVVRDDGDGARSGEDQPEREQRDRPEVAAQLVRRAEERGREEERRQERDEHELRRELELGHAREQREPEATDDEEDRVRDAHDGRERE